MNDVICNNCKQKQEIDDFTQYEEPDVNWKGLKCPLCGCADDYTELGEDK